jgi:hypothetical protein
MSPAERERAIRYLEETKAALVESTRTVAGALWHFKPSPEQWSIAECIEHLSATESQLLSVLQKMRERPEAAAEELAINAGKEEKLAAAVASRGRKVMGPPGAMPRLTTTDPNAILDRFNAIRESSIEFARKTLDPIRTRLHSHFVFGPLDGYQWLIFMAAHSERHRKKIEEIKESAAKTPLT